jgi:hypothetical protein
MNEMKNINPENEQWLSVRHLYEALKLHGASWKTYYGLLNNERRGRLTLPREQTGHRMVTASMIKEIVEAFSPGGKGEWHYYERK